MRSSFAIGPKILCEKEQVNLGKREVDRRSEAGLRASCRSSQEHRHQGIAVYDAEIAPALAGSLSERRQIELYGDAEQNRVYSLATERNQY
jgi:hypothetical protein